MNQNRSHQDLRVGIMCYGTTFPRWQAEAIKHLVAVNGVELAVLIVDIGDEVIPELSLRAKLKKAFEEGSVSRKVVGRVNAYIDKYVLLRSVSLWRIYRKLAARIHPMPCDSRVDLKKQLEGVPVLRCRAERRGRFSQYFSARDIKTIAEHNLDIILRFGFTII